MSNRLTPSEPAAPQMTPGFSGSWTGCQNLDIHGWLLQNPAAEVKIDIAETTLTLPNGEVVSFPIDQFARYCLLEGIDQMGYLQQHLHDIAVFEEDRPWTP